MSQSSPAENFDGVVVLDEIIPPGRPWGRMMKKGEVLRIIDLEGQQAADFLCYNAADLTDRYNSMNTIKMQGNIYLRKGSILYSDLGTPLVTIIEDTCGRHDTVYGCCSEVNNFLRYGVRNSRSCYANFGDILGRFGLGRGDIVSNANFFMSVPIGPDGRAMITDEASRPGDFVDLRAECDVLTVISNCPQMLNPCNGYSLTPIRCIVRRTA